MLAFFYECTYIISTTTLKGLFSQAEPVVFKDVMEKHLYFLANMKVEVFSKKRILISLAIVYYFSTFSLVTSFRKLLTRSVSFCLSAIKYAAAVILKESSR